MTQATFNFDAVEPVVLPPVEEVKQPLRNRTPMKDPNSIAAGKSVSKEEKESRRNQVIEHFLRAAEHGLTDCEIYERFADDLKEKRTTESSLRFRREEIEKDGIIIVTGKLRKTTSGRDASIRVHKFFTEQS